MDSRDHARRSGRIVVSGPLAPFADGLRRDLAGQGYALDTVTDHGPPKPAAMIAGPLMSPTMVLNRGVITVPVFLSKFTNLIRIRGGRVSHGQAPAQRARSPWAGLVEKTLGRGPVPWLCGAELPSGCRHAQRGAWAAESRPAPYR